MIEITWLVHAATMVFGPAKTNPFGRKEPGSDAEPSSCSAFRPAPSPLGWGEACCCTPPSFSAA